MNTCETKTMSFTKVVGLLGVVFLVSPNLTLAAVCGDTAVGDCCEPHPTPGCEYPSCCSAVCAAQPSCCTAAWDATCVAIADNLCGCTPPGAMTLNDYRDLVDKTLPQFGGSLLGVPPGPDWLASTSVNSVAASVQDTSPPFTQIIQQGCNNLVTVGRDMGQTKWIKIDRNKGKVRYANRLRQFDYDTFPHTAVPEPTAQMLAFQTFNALGLPASEAGSLFIRPVKGQDHNNMTGDGPPYDRERMVTSLRRVNGVPVLESFARVIISNTGQHARLLVHWPRFQMPTGLVLRTRTAVVDDIAQRIMNAMNGVPAELGLGIAYARFGPNYLPVAQLSLGSGGATIGIVQHVPLVQVPADADGDGLPDTMDNCPEDPNPCQEDNDMDGIGNRCDNCPSNANPSQSDFDGDGHGDVCDVPEGACCLTDGTCDGMVATTCAILAGDYKGNGTACQGDADSNGIDDACECACQLYADIAPPGGDCNVDVGDVICGLDCFAGVPPCASVGDIFPCGGDGNCDVGDILAVLDSFGGVYACPHPCPP